MFMCRLTLPAELSGEAAELAVCADEGHVLVAMPATAGAAAQIDCMLDGESDEDEQVPLD